MTQKEIDELKTENDELKTENMALKAQIKDMKDVCNGSCFAERRNLLIEKLKDQHQQDCIRINDLTTTIHVLSGLYSNLRKTVGMD